MNCDVTFRPATREDSRKIAELFSIDPQLRATTKMYAFAVSVEDGVWIGSGAILGPGVTVGKNSVIGTGSVVTRDIGANVVAVGNPCRVLREIGEHDKKYYFCDGEICPEDYEAW